MINTIYRGNTEFVIGLIDKERVMLTFLYVVYKNI